MLAGTMLCSRVCAACMCAGVVVGSLVAAFLGVSLCELATGLYGYDASLSFIAVYYALCCSSRRRLLHAVVAAAAATLVHTAVGLTMSRARLPAGTLGFVFSTMVVVCYVRGSESVELQRAPAADGVGVAAAREAESVHTVQQQHEAHMQEMIVLQQTFQAPQQQQGYRHI
jgi:urea transporter